MRRNTEKIEPAQRKVRVTGRLGGAHAENIEAKENVKVEIRGENKRCSGE